MSGIVGSASSPTSSGAGHARRPVAGQRSLCRRLCHRRLPTAVLGLDHRAFRRANIHCLGPRCTWWDLLVFHRCERTRRIASRPTSAASTCIALDWACCSSRSRCIRSAPSGSRSSKKRPQQASTRARIFGGLPPGFAAAASQRRCSHLCCSFCAPFWRWASDFLRRLRFSAAAPVGGPLRPNGRAPARPAPLHRLLSLQPPHNCAGALARTVSTIDGLPVRLPDIKSSGASPDNRASSTSKNWDDCNCRRLGLSE